jgi:hypothetical protein
MRHVTVRKRRSPGVRPGHRRTGRRAARTPIEGLDPRFRRALDLIGEYVRRHGTARVPGTARIGNFVLGAIVVRLRAKMRAGELSPEAIRKLEGFPGWTWQPREDDFQRGLALVRRFATREGHARVPERHRERGFKLGRWVGRQRQGRKLGWLPDAHRRVLESIHGWAWRPAVDAFDDGLRALRAFAKREGHARVLHNHVERGFRLGRWVTARRRSFRQGQLRPTHRAALERLPGWAWNAQEYRFQRGLAQLRRFAGREGHTHVPENHREGPYNLGCWVRHRREEHRRGTLSRAHTNALRKLPGWTWPGRRHP